MKRSAFTGLLACQLLNLTESQPGRLVEPDIDKTVIGAGGLSSGGDSVKYDNLVDHHSQYSGALNVYKYLNFEFSYKLKTGPQGYYHSGDNMMEQY
jgi:hypothetical protein